MEEVIGLLVTPLVIMLLFCLIFERFISAIIYIVDLIRTVEVE